MNSLESIKAFTGFDSKLKVGDLQSDSRKVVPGDVFVAVRGQIQDGRKYIDQSVEKGAVAVIYENSDGFRYEKDGIVSIGVSDLEQKLPAIASVFYGEPSRKIGLIGITGTNGKSSTAYYIAQFFGYLGIKCGIVGTVGNGFVGDLRTSVNTTPGPVEIQRELMRQIDSGAEYVAMEVSSHGIAQGRINGLTFSSTVFTNISRDHLDFHKTFDAYFNVKKGFILANNGKSAVINSDDPVVFNGLISEINQDTLITVGKTGKFRITDIKAEKKGTSFRLKTEHGENTVVVPLIGAFNVYNAVEAYVAVCASLKISDDRLIGAFSSLIPLKGRMEMFHAESHPLCLVDYAHTPDGVEKALAGAREHTAGRLICVVGCGGDRDTGKRPMMATAASALSDYLILTDDNPRTEDPEVIIRDMLKGNINCGYEIIHDRESAIRKAVSLATPSDTVIVAGKGHEDYQIIGTEKRHFSDQEVLRNILGI